MYCSWFTMLLLVPTSNFSKIIFICSHDRACHFSPHLLSVCHMFRLGILISINNLNKLTFFSMTWHMTDWGWGWQHFNGFSHLATKSKFIVLSVNYTCLIKKEIFKLNILTPFLNSNYVKGAVLLWGMCISVFKFLVCS